jgi:CBS domain-containing protein
MNIGHIYKKNPLSINENKSIEEALAILNTHRFNGLLVVNDKEKVVGIISLQDIAGAVVPEEMRTNTNLAASMFKEGFFQERCQEIKDQPIKKYMRKDFTKVTPESSVMEILADFLHNDLYIIPVYEHDKLVGVITRSEIRDVLTEAMGH